MRVGDHGVRTQMKKERLKDNGELFPHSREAHNTET